MSRTTLIFLSSAAGALAMLWSMFLTGALVPADGAVLDPSTATARFGIDGTTCYAFKIPQADGLGEHLIFCEDGRYGIHNGAAFTPRLYPEVAEDG